MENPSAQSVFLQVDFVLTRGIHFCVGIKMSELITNIKMVRNKLSWEKILPSCLFVAIIIYPFLFIWQGGDFRDTGYHALLTQRFFDDIELVGKFGYTFLTYLIGGLWWHSFSWLGLIGLRLLQCTFIVCSSLGVVYLLKGFHNKSILYLGVLTAEAYCVRYLEFIHNYDSVSLFFLVWSAVLTLTGIEKRKVVYIFVAGASIACAVMARLPSIIGLALVVIPFFDYLANSNGLSKESVGRSLINYPIKYGVFFSFGFFGLLTLVALLLHRMELLDGYIAGITKLINSTGSGKSEKMNSIFRNYLSDLKLTLQWGMLGVLWIITAGNILSSKTTAWVKSVFLLLTGIIIIFSVQLEPSYTNKLRYLGLAIYGGVSMFVIFGALATSNLLRNAAMAGLILSIATFCGSDTGLLKTAYGMVLLIPVCTMSLWNQPMTHVLGVRMAIQQVSLTVTVLVLFFSLALHIAYVHHVSSGITARLHINHRFDSPLLRGIYTTSNRAKFINRLLPELEKRIGGGAVYVYGHMPILYFLTQARPFIPKIWLNGHKYDPDTIYQALMQEAKISPLPLMLITDKMQLGERGWELMAKFLDKYKFEKVLTINEGSFDCEIWQVSSKNKYVKN